MITQTAYFPYKSTGIALVLAVLLGPVGLLYASFGAGLLLVLLGIFVVNAGYPLPIILLWLISAALSVYFVERYNQKVFKMNLELVK